MTTEVIREAFHEATRGDRFKSVQPAPAVWQRNAATPTYTVDGTTKCVTATYALEARPLAEVNADRLAALANYRYTKETCGITLIIP